MKQAMTAVIGILIGTTVLLAAPAPLRAAEPVYGTLAVTDAFAALRGRDVFHEHDRLRDDVAQAFGGRVAEGVDLAIESLRLPDRSLSGMRIANREKEHFIARTILQTFPEQSAPAVADAYASGDVVTRANLISVSGTIAGTEVTTLLREALNDVTVVEDNDPEAIGFPLRICDLAYNQLVLRHRVRGVLRTLGPAHQIGVRDYHIAILKGRLRTAP